MPEINKIRWLNDDAFVGNLQVFSIWTPDMNNDNSYQLRPSRLTTAIMDQLSGALNKDPFPLVGDRYKSISGVSQDEAFKYLQAEAAGIWYKIVHCWFT